MGNNATSVVENKLARHAAQIQATLEDAVSGIVSPDTIASIFTGDGIGKLLVDTLCAAYEASGEDERLRAVFPYIRFSTDIIDKEQVFETFPDVLWHACYDSETESFNCSTSFALEGYEDYTFDVSITKPELTGCYFVNRLSVCDADIYHKVYSELAGGLIEEYPMIGEPLFSDVLAQIQSEVEKATNGRYDDTVLEDYWAQKAEEEYNSIVELYDLAK